MKINDSEQLSKFWNGGKKMDKNERFLRNYILSEGKIIFILAWLDKSKNVNIPKEIDEEDSEKDSKFDEFEAKYNFRFEEEGGINVTTHKRDLEEGYRIKDEKRKIKRKETEQRKKNEEEKIKSELKMARSLKKEEILSKVNQLEKISGTDRINMIVNELESEYDPKNFDQLMDQIFDEKYYKELDHEDTLKNAIEEKCFDYKTDIDIDQVKEVEKKLALEDKQQGLDYLNKDFNQQEENLKNDEINEYNEEEGNEENQWWYCDGNYYFY